MALDLYLPSGYPNIPGVRKLGLPFNYFVGGRGTGKTYGGLLDVYTNKIPFIFLRRLQVQTDMVRNPDFSPFKVLNTDLGTDIQSVSIPLVKGVSGFYEMEEVEGKARPKGDALGYAMALATFSNVRGIDLSDIREIIYDEFIPEPQERPIKDEGSVFFHMYETVNRNRELKGEPPVQVMAFANAFDLGNPIFMELGVIRLTEKMKAKGQSIYINQDRGLGIFLLDESPISKQKADTALYRLTRSGSFNELALNNKFDIDDHMVRPAKLIEYRPIVAIGEICIYQHKSQSLWYVSSHTSGHPEVYLTSDTDRARFVNRHSSIWARYINSQVYFEDYACEIVFRRYFGY